jgi:hypothetical protein
MRSGWRIVHQRCCGHGGRRMMMSGRRRRRRRWHGRTQWIGNGRAGRDRWGMDLMRVRSFLGRDPHGLRRWWRWRRSRMWSCRKVGTRGRRGDLLLCHASRSFRSLSIGFLEGFGIVFRIVGYRSRPWQLLITLTGRRRLRTMRLLHGLWWSRSTCGRCWLRISCRVHLHRRSPPLAGKSGSFVGLRLFTIAAHVLLSTNYCFYCLMLLVLRCC